MPNILSKDGLYAYLKACPESSKYWVACSGGMDSCVLLHLFYLNRSRIEQDIEIIYVNHQLQKQNDTWEVFCNKLCQQYNLKFRSLRITEDCPKEMSIEEWARDQRYSLIAEKINPNDILFTAHHLDDQIETFFLHALRGSGPRGLVAMPAVKPFAKGYHVRPLLDCARSELQHYAEQNQLDWHDDPSNEDLRFNRNYLRNKILPAIQERWPSYRSSILRMVQHQQEVKLLLDEVAEEDLGKSRIDNNRGIDLDRIQYLSAARKKNLIAYWLKSRGLNLPGSKHMNEIIASVIEASEDKVPCVNWNGVEIRRYRNILYAISPLSVHEASEKLQWNLQQTIKLLDDCLQASSTKGKGISKKYIMNDVVEIRYRQGGEKIHPCKQNFTRTVKQLFQEHGVLPWYRDRIPLIYVEEELAQIPGICIDEKFCAKNDEAAWDIKWTGYEKAIQ